MRRVIPNNLLFASGLLMFCFLTLAPLIDGEFIAFRFDIYLKHFIDVEGIKELLFLVHTGLLATLIAMFASPRRARLAAGCWLVLLVLYILRFTPRDFFTAPWHYGRWWYLFAVLHLGMIWALVTILLASRAMRSPTPEARGSIGC